MDCLDSKNLKIEEWKIERVPVREENILVRKIITEKDDLCCCSISTTRTLFHLDNSNNYYLDIYISKKNNKITKSFNIDDFRGFKTLFEAVLYADLYLKNLGLICLKKINYNPKWEMILNHPKS